MVTSTEKIEKTAAGRKLHAAILSLLLIFAYCPKQEENKVFHRKLCEPDGIFDDIEMGLNGMDRTFFVVTDQGVHQIFMRRI